MEIETLLDDPAPVSEHAAVGSRQRKIGGGGVGALLGALAAVLVGVVLVATGAILLNARPQVVVDESNVPTADLPTADGTTGAEAGALPDAQWVEQTAAKTGIPPRALQAYASAALVLAQENPDCNLGWNTLAGIGWVESHHGTINGSAIDEDGWARPAIVGVALDGDGVADISDTDGGRYDGDPIHDRAVGPMQFIPRTWQLYGADGNADGMNSPQQIDDAALAAGQYLCTVGEDLSIGENWIAAVSAYNAPVEYVTEVSSAATHYAEWAR